jgi:hypothetical protein
MNGRLKQPGGFPFLLSVDGFEISPSMKKKKSSMYSVSPIVMINLNLPPSLRYRREFLFLVGIIPGPHKPRQLEAYFELLTDELLELYEEGTFVSDLTIYLPCSKLTE